ncbi:MAG: TIM barrel protein [Anaerolineae bacterium]|nr:TIM barrel protein [Anaerolineae bacterium]
MEFTGFLDFWFADRPLIERIEGFARLGIRRLNVWSWRMVDMAALSVECKTSGCILDSTFDDQMGSLVDPNDNDLTLRSWAESLEMAERYGVESLFIFSNQVDRVSDQSWSRRLSRGVTEAEQYANLLDQTEKILKMVEKTRVKVIAEPLNTFHIQGGILVHDHDLAADWVRRMNHPQFKMVFDCYHQQLTAGNLFYKMESCLGLYDAFHVADVPGRLEPGSGEINFPNLWVKLRSLGYDGYIGLEFKPSRSEAETFERVKAIFKP